MHARLFHATEPGKNQEIEKNWMSIRSAHLYFWRTTVSHAEDKTVKIMGQASQSQSWQAIVPGQKLTCNTT